MDKIGVNIWDDYHDDGYVPAGKIQETYAYVESELDENVKDTTSKIVLELLKVAIDKYSKPEWNLELSVEYYDSAKTYPSLVGTEHEWCLYKRWQLNIKHLTHKSREELLEKLQKENLDYANIPLDIYSES
jgi:hypothetical protein